MKFAGDILIGSPDLEGRHTLLDLRSDQDADPICAPTMVVRAHREERNQSRAVLPAAPTPTDPQSTSDAH
jgi:hypothetical protein